MSVGKVFKDFKIISLIGKGTYGDVYLAEMIGDEKEYAVKVTPITKDLFYRPYSLNEINNLRLLNYLPNIVQIKSIYRDEFNSYIFMEKMEMDLIEYINVSSVDDRLTNLQVFMINVCTALLSMKYLKMVHNDVKPDNVLLNKYGFHLSDFGESGFDWRKHDKLVGTPDYLPPEKLVGIRNNNYAGDIWSFGLTVYAYITGDIMIDTSETPVEKLIYKILDLSNSNEKYHRSIDKIEDGTIKAKITMSDKISKLILDKIDNEYINLLERMLDLNYKTRINLEDIMSKLKYIPEKRDKSALFPTEYPVISSDHSIWIRLLDYCDDHIHIIFSFELLKRFLLYFKGEISKKDLDIYILSSAYIIEIYLNDDIYTNDLNLMPKYIEYNEYTRDDFLSATHTILNTVKYLLYNLNSHDLPDRKIEYFYYVPNISLIKDWYSVSKADNILNFSNNLYNIENKHYINGHFINDELIDKYITSILDETGDVRSPFYFIYFLNSYIDDLEKENEDKNGILNILHSSNYMRYEYDDIEKYVDLSYDKVLQILGYKKWLKSENNTNYENIIINEYLFTLVNPIIFWKLEDSEIDFDINSYADDNIKISILWNLYKYIYTSELYPPSITVRHIHNTENFNFIDDKNRLMFRFLKNYYK